jgi:hypothetical protein
VAELQRIGAQEIGGVEQVGLGQRIVAQPRVVQRADAEAAGKRRLDVAPLPAARRVRRPLLEPASVSVSA